LRFTPGPPYNLTSNGPSLWLEVRLVVRFVVYHRSNLTSNGALLWLEVRLDLPKPHFQRAFSMVGSEVGGSSVRPAMGRRQTQEVLLSATRSKYRACPTVVDGIRFHSTAEAVRYSELKLMQASGLISELKLQFPYPVYLKGQLICTYYADFVYFDHHTSRWITEDVKGVRTPLYRLKKRLVEVAYDMTITEVPA